jgi:hypothetical protein
VAEQQSKVKQTRHASRPSASPVDTMLMLVLLLLLLLML